MLYPSINEIRKKADSRYTIVNLAAKRARDIIDGKPILTDSEINKPVSLAAHEIAEDLITYRRPEQACMEEETESEEIEA
ncbi:MAG: DNA-directed RNA polymerase subunit omega [Emergencia sp.]|nr:DNA-directed RNA polymerase subunit omega [Emergencia sp.]